MFLSPKLEILGAGKHRTAESSFLSLSFSRISHAHMTGDLVVFPGLHADFPTKTRDLYQTPSCVDGAMKPFLMLGGGMAKGRGEVPS